MRREGGTDDDARLRFGFRLVTSRHATDAELAVLRSLLTDLRAHWAAEGHAEKAKELLAVGAFRENPAPGAAPAANKDEKKNDKPNETKDAKATAEERRQLAESAAWAHVGTTLLNLEAAIRRG